MEGETVTDGDREGESVQVGEIDGVVDGVCVTVGLTVGVVLGDGEGL